MLRHFIFTIFVFLCSVGIDAKEIDMETAKSWAVDFFRFHECRRERKSTGAKGNDMALVYKITDGAGFYVFNLSKGGWVITSNNDEARKILAFSDSGTFDMVSAPETVRHWLDKYCKEIESVVNGNRHEREESENIINPNRRKREVHYDDIAPLIKTQWSQDEPYNLFCPIVDGERTPSGCVATAMAQLMYYYQWPVAGIGRVNYDIETNGIRQTIESDLYAHSYKWELMGLKTEDFTTEEMREAVAQLMYDAGVAIKTIYSPNASSAYTSEIPGVMQKNFCYENAFYVSKTSMDESTWKDNILCELSAGHPILYSGMDSNDFNASGHQFICDGYQCKNGDDFFHFNWGWGGTDDGFYTLSAVGNTYQFCYEQDAILFMKPHIIDFHPVELDGYDKTLYLADGITTPLPEMSLGGYSFHGWTTERMESARSEKPNVSVNHTPKSPATLYPVFSYSGKDGNGGRTTIFSEDFSSITVGNSTSASGSSSAWDYNGNIPNGQNAYKAGGAIKLGKGDSNGYITTKTIEAHSGDELTIEFDVKGWTTVEGNIIVSTDGCDAVCAGYSATMNDQFEHQSLTMTLTKDNPTITLSTTAKRAFIDNLTISSGAAQTTYYCTSGTPFSADMRITSARWATWYAPFDAEIEDGVRAFTVGTEDGELKMEEVEGIIPAHTAVLLYGGSEMDKSLNGLFSCIGNGYEGNMLTGTLTNIYKIARETDGRTNYVLQNGRDGVMWYRVVYDQEHNLYNNVGANRAFLSVTEGVEVKSLANGMELASSIGIDSRTIASQDNHYNLAGQKVGKDYKGIVIIGGKKVIRK